jgi:DNA-directed RNA polymerase
LKVIFDALIQRYTVNNIAVQIGTRIEDQIRFTIFEDEHEAYYEGIIDDFKRKNTVEYRHMRNVMRHVAAQRDGWVDWTQQERLSIGCKMIELCIQATGLVDTDTCMESKNKKVMRLIATPETMTWIEEHVAFAELLHPEVIPCIIKPNPWVALDDGGFFTPEIRRRAPFVKIKSVAHAIAIRDKDFSKPMAAATKLQETAWCVNKPVFQVLKDVWDKSLGIGMPSSAPFEKPPCPLPEGKSSKDLNEYEQLSFNTWKRQIARVYTAERERISKCISLARVMSLANKFSKYEEFYYVYNADFRGRLYATTPGFSPQGADFAKGVLQFRNGRAITEPGLYWLAVQLANTYGYDKDSFDGRVRWVAERRDIIYAVAANPLGSEERAFWSDADKPYQCLAACIEYARVDGNPAALSYLPISMDGSCNGIQNFSAMLRDGVGGGSTNLKRSAQPSDIYQDVADVCIRKLQGDTNEYAADWLEFGVTRKLTKKPVMTLPYGSTLQACRESVEDYIFDNNSTGGLYMSPWEGIEVFRAARYMSTIIWESISEVVVAARGAMQWLREMAQIVSKENLPIEWTTPLGFHVYQCTMKQHSIRVKTQLMGRVDLSLSSDTTDVDKLRQKNGIAPNFVHSMDATHLMMTVLNTPAVQSWMMVHDSYGCPADQVELMRTSIRESFVELYTDNDVLRQFQFEIAEQLFSTDVNDLPELPEYGDLNIDDVLESDYFFG